MLGLLSKGQQHGYDLKRAARRPVPRRQGARLRPRSRRCTGPACRTRGSWSRRPVSGSTARTDQRPTASPRRGAKNSLGGSPPSNRSRSAPPYLVATKVTLLLLTEGTHRAVEHLVRERAARVERMRQLTTTKHRSDTTLQEVLATDLTLAHSYADLHLDRVGPPPDPRPRGGDRMTTSVLSPRGVVHDYEGTPALLGVDLDVAEGQVLAITGPSGSGKSTLLLCLAGILVPREGSVHLGGVDLRLAESTTCGPAPPVGRHRLPVRHPRPGAHRRGKNVALPLLLGQATAPRSSPWRRSGSSASGSRRSPAPRRPG